MSERPANTPKKTVPKTAWKKGQSGNPLGAPKRGEGWAEAIKKVGDMTPAELAEMLGTRSDLGRQFKQMPLNIPIKQLVISRVYSALMFEPQPGLFNALMDRAEGKVQTTVDVTSKGEKLGPNVVIFQDADQDSEAAPSPPPTGGSGSGNEAA